MSFIRSFERRFLFPLTRGLALVFIFTLLLAIAATAARMSGTFLPSSKVTPNEVIEAIKPAAQNSNTGRESANQDNGFSSYASSDILANIKLPFQIQKYFNTPQNLDILRSWLTPLSADKRKEFLDELATTISEAEKLGLDVKDAINTYKAIKLSRIETVNAADQEIAQERLYSVGGAFGCVVLIALFSLILVLLSIERNTRRE